MIDDNSQKIPESPLEKLLAEGKISQSTYQKVLSAKKYIERKYNMIKLKRVENNILMEKLKCSGLPENKKLEILTEIRNQEIQNNQKKLEKMSASNYESLSIIGRGAFGEVHVCREKKTGDIVAIKKIKKDVLLSKNQIKHTLDEQDFLSKVKSPWIVKLKASFQEGDYLYLVMEYLPGGDLMGLFIAKDILTEEEARFYICEMILAIDSIHELNCIHRDIKPDNVLIGKDGHIKLTDFGLAKISDKAFKEDIIDYRFDETKVRHNRNYSCVGTAYYVAPEVIMKKGYGPEIDWWSLGVILFEMISGYAPFCSKKTNDVCYKVTHFKQYLKFPSKCQASDTCKDLIYKLVNNSDVRLGKKGSSEIKAHPFFKGINWLKIKDMKPPFIPEIKSDYDVKYFDEFNYIEPFIPPKDKVVRKRREPEYTGYTFKGEEIDPTDILSVINLIQKKKLEFDKEKDLEKTKKNISELKIYSNEEIQENKKTQDSSNHNSNIIKEVEKKKIDIKPYFTKKNPINITNNNKYDINLLLNNNIKNKQYNTINAKKTNENLLINLRAKNNDEVEKSPNIPLKNAINKINKKNERPSIPQPPMKKRKKTLLENMSRSFKLGIKKVFLNTHSKSKDKKDDK